jgi:methyl-accepting chemotaxis protein
MSRTTSLFTISRRIGLLGLVGIAGVLAIGGVALTNSHRLEELQVRANAASATALLVAQIDAQLLDVRRAEKDFLLRSDEKYATRHSEISRAVGADLGKLSASLPPGEQGALRQKLDAIRAGFSAYERSVTELVATSRRLGLDENSGLQGALRASVRSVEERLAKEGERDLTILMLQMRRHEKDFMLRLDPKYGSDMQKRAAEFEKVLAASTLPPQARSEIAERMASYQRDFAEYLAGRLSVVEGTKAISRAYAEIDPVVEEVGRTLRQQFETAQAEIAQSRAAAERLLWLLGGGVLLIVGVLSLLIGRAIARPVVGMTATMDRLAAGDTAVPVPSVTRSDEIGAMARAVEVFKRNAIERDRLEAESRDATARIEAEKRRAMLTLAESFEQTVGALVQTLARSAAELQQTAHAMSSAADQASRQSGVVACAAQATPRASRRLPLQSRNCPRRQARSASASRRLPPWLRRPSWMLAAPTRRSRPWRKGRDGLAMWSH